MFGYGVLSQDCGSMTLLNGGSELFAAMFVVPVGIKHYIITLSMYVEDKKRKGKALAPASMTMHSYSESTFCLQDRIANLLVF